MPFQNFTTVVYNYSSELFTVSISFYDLFGMKVSLIFYHNIPVTCNKNLRIRKQNTTICHLFLALPIHKTNTLRVHFFQFLFNVLYSQVSAHKNEGGKHSGNKCIDDIIIYPKRKLRKRIITFIHVFRNHS